MAVQTPAPSKRPSQRRSPFRLGKSAVTGSNKIDAPYTANENNFKHQAAGYKPAKLDGQSPATSTATRKPRPVEKKISGGGVKSPVKKSSTGGGNSDLQGMFQIVITYELVKRFSIKF